MAFLANPLSIVNAFIAVVPAGLIFFLAYGRYDGGFRDQTVFLHFMGGLLLGGLLGFLTLLLYAIDAAFLQVLIPSLLFPVALTAAVNRRSWQGERHAIFNGGALGLGVAVMMSFSLIFARIKEMDPAALIQGALLATSLAGLFFGLGLLSGNGVRMKKPFRMGFLGTAIFLAPAVFLEEFFRSGAWLWVILLVIYALVFAFAAEQRVMILGLADEYRRGRRRRQRSNV